MTAFKLPSKSAVYKQIRDVGISRATLNRVLPAWWDDALLQSNSGFLQFAKVLDQRLGLSVSVNDGNVSFLPAAYTVQFKNDIVIRKNINFHYATQTAYSLDTHYPLNARLAAALPQHMKIVMSLWRFPFLKTAALAESKSNLLFRAHTSMQSAQH